MSVVLQLAIAWLGLALGILNPERAELSQIEFRGIWANIFRVCHAMSQL